MDSAICFLMVVISNKCAKRHAHKRPGDRTSSSPSAAQRDSIENKQGTARPRGRSAAGPRCVFVARRLGHAVKRIESGGLSVPLSPEEIVEGVAGSATSTVYTIVATLL